MADEILNHTLKGLLLADKTVSSLEPILQDGAGTQRHLFDVCDVALQFHVCHSVEGGVCRGAEPVDRGEVELGWRRRLSSSRCAIARCGGRAVGLGAAGAAP